MSIEIETVQVGPLPTNCYIAQSGSGCLLVDPGDDASVILAALKGRKPDVIVLTHRHWDHVGAVDEVARKTGAPIAAYTLDADAACDTKQNGASSYGIDNAVSRVDIRLQDGDVLEAGPMRFEVLHTPGHTIGGMCLFEPEGNVLFSGDTLFFGTVGRTDLPTGNMQQMQQSCERLAQLPDDCRVYPGHDRSTTIGRERNINPLMRYPREGME